MENNQENINAIQKQSPTNFGGIEIFAIKTGITLIVIFILAIFILPDINEFRINLKRLETPKSKLILLSFVQNPRALLKISEMEEAEGKLDNAIREAELAIGLLEMHGADKQVIQKYSNKVDELVAKKLKMAATPAHNK